MYILIYTYRRIYIYMSIYMHMLLMRAKPIICSECGDGIFDSIHLLQPLTAHRRFKRFQWSRSQSSTFHCLLPCRMRQLRPPIRRWDIYSSIWCPPKQLRYISTNRSLLTCLPPLEIMAIHLWRAVSWRPRREQTTVTCFMTLSTNTLTGTSDVKQPRHVPWHYR